MGGAVSAITDTVGGVVDTVKDVADSDLGKAALLAAGAYYGIPALAEGWGAATPELLGEASGAWATSPALSGGAGLLGGLSTGQMLGLGAGALALGGGLGGKQPSSSTSSTSIDPDMKAAYFRNLQEARATAAALGERQFAALPEYSTNMVQKYMNPYQTDVINASMNDIDRQRQMQQLKDRSSATAAKAFGGSRQGVAEALTNEAYDRTTASTVANLRNQGFTNAQAIALQQEEAKRQYEQQKLDAVRNLGLERLNVSSSALGVPLANLGGTSTTPIYKNTGAGVLGGALSGGVLGKMIGPEYAGYGAAAGGLLGLIG